jgi:hypothetical protein
MSRNLVRKTHTFSSSALSIATFTLLAVVVAVAQVKDAGNASEQPASFRAARGVVPAEVLQHPRQHGTDSAQPILSPPAQVKESGVNSLDSDPLILSLFPSVFYDIGVSGPDRDSVSVFMEDVNGDHKLDMVVIATENDWAGDGVVVVLLGNGDGTFQPPVSYGTGGYAPGSGAIADINGDGKPDIVVSNCSTQNDSCEGDIWVGVLLGNGDGTFQSPQTYDAGGSGFFSSLAVADVNGDGKPDVLVTDCLNSSNCSSAAVSVLLGNGDGTFQPPVAYRVPWQPNSVVVADLNGDGKPDLIVGDSVVSVLLGNGDGTFQPAVTYNLDGAASSVAVADVNGDGIPDVLAVNPSWNTVNVLLGNGDGTFQSAQAYPAVSPFSPVGPHQIVLSDINGDGKLDVVVALDGVGLLLGNGDGTFGPMTLYDFGQGWESIAVGDVNGDKKPDVASFDSYSTVLSALLNNNGAPASTLSLTSSANPVTVKKSVSYIASVTPQSGGTAQGSVEFMDEFGSVPVVIGTAPVTANQATLIASYTYPGSHSITAVYSGDLNHTAGSISGGLTEIVRGTSVTKETTSGSPSQVGQPVTFTAKIKSKYGPIPDGEQVTFTDGKALLATIALSGGQAAYTTSALSGGIHEIKATYAGDATLAPSTGSVRQVVIKYATTTTLVSSQDPSGHAQPVTFTATVTSAGPTPTGSVKFFDGTIKIGAATLSGGVAKVTKSRLTVGSHSITAAYLGDGASGLSTSPALDQVVNP